MLSGCGKVYTVTFMDEGQVLASVTVKKGENIASYDKPSKDGYIFVSWNKDGFSYDNKTPINDDITLTASWTPEPTLVKNYTVSFNYGEQVKTQTVKEGELAVKPEKDPKLDKHKFLGWFVGETLYDFSLPVEKDIVLMAKFEKIRVIISYDLDGGSGLAETEINKGSIPQKPKNPTKLGYDFIGWSINGVSYNFDTPINEDTTIKANYSATVYVRVSFDTDGGNDIKTEYIKSGSKLSNIPTPVKEGYTFKYWSYNGQVFDKEMVIDKNINLLAIYEKNDNQNEEENA